ncbi:MAG: DNA polymerase III subunit delta [Burkholderiaceae bacterium]
MQLAAAQLSAHLQKGLKPLYALHGDELLLVQEAADTIRAAARSQGYSQRTSFTVAGAHFDWGEVLAATGSPGLFASRQIVEVNLPSGKPGKTGSAALQQLAAQLQAQDDTLLLVTLPRLDKPSKTSAWFACLEQFGVALQIEPVERQALPQWIAQRLQRQGQCVEGGELGQQTLQFFADRVEGNLLAAQQEIRKLALLYPAAAAGAQAKPQVLTLAQVQSAVTNVARYDVFKLSEAVLSGQLQRTTRMLEGLRAEGEAEVLVHWALAEDIAALARVKDALNAGRPMPLALREQRVWGPRERLFERLLPRLATARLGELLLAAHQVDGIVKGLPAPGWPTSGWQALHRLAVLLCQACQGTSAPARGA